ncbi:hypothetical protein [Fusobacterium sp. MFO224]|uniref:hypothetical protein n=1 Tax=Fusobacterium sp. MFO224 TaxID=3378070 RepID=UPI003853F5C5
MAIKRKNERLKLDFSNCCHEIELVIGKSEEVKDLRVLGMKQEILLELNIETSCLEVCSNILKEYDIKIERA